MSTLRACSNFACCTGLIHPKHIALSDPLAVLQPLSIALRGITNSVEDPSVDVWRAVTLPLLRKVTGAEGPLQLKITRRGAPPKVSGFAAALLVAR